MTAIRQTQESAASARVVAAMDLPRALDRVPTPMAVLGREGRFGQVNPAFGDLLDYEPGDLRGVTWKQVVVPEDHSTCEEFMASATSGGADRAVLHVRFRKAGGEVVSVILGAAAIRDAHGEVSGFVGHLQDITDQVETLAALADSEERHRVLFERLPVALYRTSPSGEILEANAALAELLGYPDVASLKGLNASDAYVADGERAAVADRMEADGLVEGHESQLRRRDGSVIWVRDTARVVHDGDSVYYEGSLVDITDRKRAELELVTRARQQESLARLGRLALEHTDLSVLFDAAVAALTDVFQADQSGILVLDEDGGFLFEASTRPHERRAVAAPPGRRSLAAYTAEHSDPVIVDELETDPRFETPQEQTVRGLRSAISARITLEGRTYGVVGSFSSRPAVFGPESCDFIQSVANVLAAAIERDGARRRLEELVRSKDEFIASVSHEVRTPLTVVSGLAQELADTWQQLPPSEVAEFMGLIVDHSRDMSNLIDDLLVAARADIGKVPIHPEEFDLCDAAFQALAGLKPEDGIRVVVAPASALAYADRSRVRQIVRNLLTNAFRYGGTEIEVECGSGDDLVWLEVRDDGEGIASDDVDKVFDPYHRAHRTAGQPSSVGLGLTVSRKLARLMGGDLTYANDGRTVFRLSLPASLST